MYIITGESLGGLCSFSITISCMLFGENYLSSTMDISWIEHIFLWYPGCYVALWSGLHDLLFGCQLYYWHHLASQVTYFLQTSVFPSVEWARKWTNLNGLWWGFYLLTLQRYFLKPESQSMRHGRRLREAPFYLPFNASETARDCQEVNKAQNKFWCGICIINLRKCFLPLLTNLELPSPPNTHPRKA